MYKSINDILKALESPNNVTYPVKYNHGEYNKAALWNLLSDNFEIKYEYFHVIGNFHVENQHYVIISHEFSEDDFVRASKLLKDRITVGSYDEPLSGVLHPAYLAVMADAEVNGNNNVSPEIISKFLELEGTICDFDMMVYIRLITKNKINLVYTKNPEFKELVERYGNVMRLVRYAVVKNNELL